MLLENSTTTSTGCFAQTLYLEEVDLRFAAPLGALNLKDLSSLIQIHVL